MNLELLKANFLYKFEETAHSQTGRDALDWAGDCVDNWAEAASAELERRMMQKVLANFSDDDLVNMLMNDDLKIDFNQLIWDALQKV